MILFIYAMPYLFISQRWFCAVFKTVCLPITDYILTFWLFYISETVYFSMILTKCLKRTTNNIFFKSETGFRAELSISKIFTISTTKCINYVNYKKQTIHLEIHKLYLHTHTHARDQLHKLKTLFRTHVLTWWHGIRVLLIYDFSIVVSFCRRKKWWRKTICW